MCTLLLGSHLKTDHADGAKMIECLSKLVVVIHPDRQRGDMIIDVSGNGHHAYISCKDTYVWKPRCARYCTYTHTYLYIYTLYIYTHTYILMYTGISCIQWAVSPSSYSFAHLPSHK